MAGRGPFIYEVRLTRPLQSLDKLLARTTLVTFNWLQRVTLGVGVASGVACASCQNHAVVFLRMR